MEVHFPRKYVFLVECLVRLTGVEVPMETGRGRSPPWSSPLRKWFLHPPLESRPLTNGLPKSVGRQGVPSVPERVGRSPLSTEDGRGVRCVDTGVPHRTTEVDRVSLLMSRDESLSTHSGTDSSLT